MKSLRIFLLFFCLTAVSGFAQTNFVPRLEADGQVYSNIYILRTTASYAVVQFDGGAAQIALSNFPPEIQQQYSYEPEKARQEAIAEKAKREQAAIIEAQRAAALAKTQSWRGQPVTATIITVQGPLSVWTKCQIMVSNKTETVLLANLPASVKQFFDNRNAESNRMAVLSAYVDQESKRLAELTASMPRRPAANSPAGRTLRQIRVDQKALADKRAELQKMETTSRKTRAEEDKATRVTVRQTAQTYASLPVWECVK